MIISKQLSKGMEELEHAGDGKAEPVTPGPTGQ